jgi:hypothetical protein
MPDCEQNIEIIFNRLKESEFRTGFRLRGCELAYLQRKGLEGVVEHAEKFVRDRLALAEPPNDGKQTPMRGHPAFLAQHATATCCRGCLKKWHGIEKHRALTLTEIHYVVAVIRRWLSERVPARPIPRPEAALLPGFD